MKIEKRIEKWVSDNETTETALAEKLGMSKENFSHYKRSRASKEKTWPLWLAEKISKITKGEVEVEHFYSLNK